MEVVRVRYLQLFYSTLLSAYMQPWKLNTFFFIFCTVKILEVELTLKRSPQLQSGLIQVQVVVHLLQGFSVILLVQWRFLTNNKCKQNSFCDCIFVLYSCIIGWTLKPIHMQIFMSYWNFEYTKALTLHCGKSGRWYRSCNWGKPFWVKLTSSFFPVCLLQC